MSYYRYIQGVRYDRSLLELAEKLAAGSSPASLGLPAVQQLHESALDGRRVTDTEKRTLRYVIEHFAMEEQAREWLLRQLGDPDVSALQDRIRQVVREEYRLRNLSWEVQEAEVQRQESLSSSLLFESALRGALDAFLRHNRGQLSLAAFVNREELARTASRTPESFLRQYLDQGTLYLLPLEDNFPPDHPPEYEPDATWTFLLRIPHFEPALFSAYVSREGNFKYSKGYFSNRVPLEELIAAIVRRFAGLPGLQWRIDPAEVERQLDLRPGQHFGNALFSAVYSGLYNGESSLSIRDFLRDDVWPDPERPLDDHIGEYANRGTLHLIPLDYRAQTQAGTASFPIPEMFSFWTEGEWIFGLDMPDKTDARFIINVPRDHYDGELGWNDGFLPTYDSIREGLRRVLEREFELPEINLIFPESEFEAQARQFGPDWRSPASLLRQALNTIIHDYLEPRSVFNRTAKKESDDIRPEDFESDFAWREAVSRKVLAYLGDATLELLPIELPDNNPVDGEEIDTYWQFFALLPGLSRVGFFVIIPRWPEEDQRPYVYHGA